MSKLQVDKFLVTAKMYDYLAVNLDRRPKTMAEDMTEEELEELEEANPPHEIEPEPELAEDEALDKRLDQNERMKGAPGAHQKE